MCFCILSRGDCHSIPSIPSAYLSTEECSAQNSVTTCFENAIQQRKILRLALSLATIKSGITKSVYPQNSPPGSPHNIPSKQAR